MNLWSVQRPLSSSTASACTPHPASCLTNACHWSQGDQASWEWGWISANPSSLQMHHSSASPPQANKRHSLPPQRWAPCNGEMLFNNTSVVSEGRLFFSCAENKCRLLSTSSLGLFKSMVQAKVPRRSFKSPGILVVCSWVSDVRHAMAAWAAGLQQGGWNYQQQLDHCMSQAVFVDTDFSLRVPDGRRHQSWSARNNTQCIFCV